MTEEQIEKAARAYCTAMGLDPDAEIGGFDGTKKTSIIRWKAEVYEIRKHLALQQSLIEAQKD